MSQSNNNNLKRGHAIPVFDPDTSKFKWVEASPPPPEKPSMRVYGIEVADQNGNPMPFIADGIRVMNSRR